MNYALTALLVFCLIAWGFVLVPPVVRLFGGVVRPTDSIGSFRNKMSVLGGSTPRSYIANPAMPRPATATAEVEGFGAGVVDLRESGRSPSSGERVADLASHRRSRPADSARRREARQRRRNIFTGLLASLPVTFLLAVVVGGPTWLLFTVAMVAFAGYTALLWQMNQAALERSRKVVDLGERTPAPAASTSAGLRHISVVGR